MELGDCRRVQRLSKTRAYKGLEEGGDADSDGEGDDVEFREPW